MAKARLSSLQHPDPVINRIQDQVVKAIASLEGDCITTLATVGPVAIGTGDTMVFHGLGRAPQGRFIVGQDADARIWDGSASSNPALFVNLKASAAVNITLVFY